MSLSVKNFLVELRPEDSLSFRSTQPHLEALAAGLDYLCLALSIKTTLEDLEPTVALHPV